DLGDQLGIVSALGIEPEHSRYTAVPGTGYGQLDPVLDRCVFGLAHAPDITFLHSVLELHLAVLVGDTHGAIAGNMEGLVVRTVFFGFLGHQADIGHATHGRRVEGAIGLTILNHGLVDAGVAAVRNHRLGIVKLV